MFLVKFFAGFFSGYLLDRYCPETGPRQSSLMWFLIFLTSVTSPVLLALMHYCCDMWAPLFRRVQSADEKKEQGGKMDTRLDDEEVCEPLLKDRRDDDEDS